MVVVGPTQTDAEAIAMELTGIRNSPYCQTAVLGDVINDLAARESIVVFDPANSEMSRFFIATVKSANPNCNVIKFAGDSAFDFRNTRATQDQILGNLPDRAVSFGRFFPAFRPAAVKAVTDDMAVKNAKFAFAANLPTLIPFVGSLATTAADLVFITKNQALLVYKIAAIHDRDLSDHIGIYQEMAPVIGAGFLWRTLAREAVSFLPFAAGTIPKVGIAYSGTVAVGQGADYYYRTGEKPSKEQLIRYYNRSLRVLKGLKIPGISTRIKPKEMDVDYRLLDSEIC
jgi:uncharacterized protein (DUF697 family)